MPTAHECSCFPAVFADVPFITRSFSRFVEHGFSAENGHGFNPVFQTGIDDPVQHAPVVFSRFGFECLPSEYAVVMQAVDPDSLTAQHGIMTFDVSADDPERMFSIRRRKHSVGTAVSDCEDGIRINPFCGEFRRGTKIKRQERNVFSAALRRSARAEHSVRGCEGKRDFHTFPAGKTLFAGNAGKRFPEIEVIQFQGECGRKRFPGIVDSLEFQLLRSGRCDPFRSDHGEFEVRCGGVLLELPRADLQGVEPDTSSVPADLEKGMQERFFCSDCEMEAFPFRCDPDGF